MIRRLFGVKCYDPKSKGVYYLFKSELDYSYIRANVINSKVGTVWIKASELKQSDDYRHPPLSPEQKRDVNGIMDNLRGFYDLTYEEWESGFRKDMDIEKNIAIFVVFSAKLREMANSMILDVDEKRDLFRMMMAVINNGREFACKNVKYVGQIEKRKNELTSQFAAL